MSICTHSQLPHCSPLLHLRNNQENLGSVICQYGVLTVLYPLCSTQNDDPPAVAERENEPELEQVIEKVETEAVPERNADHCQHHAEMETLVSSVSAKLQFKPEERLGRKLRRDRSLSPKSDVSCSSTASREVVGKLRPRTAKNLSGMKPSTDQGKENAV